MGKKIPVIKTDRYILYIEDYCDSLFIHCDVFKWDIRTRKSLEVALNKLLEFYQKDLYALHENTQDNKHKKFLEIFGFKLYSEEIGLDGLVHQVWRVKNKTKEIK